MRTHRHPARSLALLFCVALAPAYVETPARSAAHQWVLSANESKLDLITGVSRVVGPEGNDSLTLMDFAQVPPSVVHVPHVSNTVLGPPSNVSITPDGRWALVSDSIRLDPANPGKWIPSRFIHVFDLAQSPPRRVGQGESGEQPSGLAIAPNGRLVLAANRAGGSVTAFRFAEGRLEKIQEIALALPADEVSDVAISADGHRAFASVRLRGYLRELRIEGESVTATERKFSAYGRPYRIQLTPDGALALTAGEGFGNGGDIDALSIIDLTATPPRTAEHVPLGRAPETVELSPDGRWLAAVLMNGSNLAPGDPFHTDHGQIVLLERSGKSFRKHQTIDVGPIPEGAIFTPDGRHLVVQCHPEQRLWVFEVSKRGLKDTGLRISVPGRPSGLGTIARGIADARGTK
ncbi:MAG: hypothetical protein HYR88_00545 [Verrucomicrobia bacterium]|nr:hypothetical protein [Verrucomicrobiota bacterium]MBI3867517.1 hypothetical protein [Verrucomicrobiota bacterium]